MAAPSPATTCIKCSAPMEFGLLADSTHSSAGYGGPERPLEWVRGIPKRNWWNMGFKTGPGDRIQVATLRCTACGYLEAYAPAPGQ